MATVTKEYTINANRSCSIKTTTTNGGSMSSSTSTSYSYMCGDKGKVPQSATYMANMGTYNKAFNEIELKKTNDLRKLHGAPPMVLDEEAAKSA